MNTNNKHTAGQWEVNKYGRKILVETTGGKIIAEQDTDFREEAEAEANAKLISAAPNLLNCLNALVNFCQFIPKEVFTESGKNDFQAILHKSAEAIEKATTL